LIPTNLLKGLQDIGTGKISVLTPSRTGEGGREAVG
jgi:hypothetical protein